MCHSVEMYLPEMTRRTAEQRIGEVDFAAAARERRMFGAGLDLLARLKACTTGWLPHAEAEGTRRERMTHG